MGRLAGRPRPRVVVARVHEVTGGNPLFVGEVVRALLAGGQLGGAEGQVTDPMLRIPEELRGLLHRRLAGLSTEAVANLKVASVVGSDFELRVLRRVSRLSVGRLSEALAEAERAGIVSEDASAPGRYVFSHELVREALYDDLPAARRLKLHRAIGLALEAAFRGRPRAAFRRARPPLHPIGPAGGCGARRRLRHPCRRPRRGAARL